MIRHFKTYDTDDWADWLIGYSPSGFAIPDKPAAVPPPEPIPGRHGGKAAYYLLQMAAEREEFTARELFTRFGIAKQGAYFYETLNSLLDAGVLIKRVGKSNIGYYRGADNEDC